MIMTMPEMSENMQVILQLNMKKTEKNQATQHKKINNNNN